MRLLRNNNRIYFIFKIYSLYLGCVIGARVFQKQRQKIVEPIVLLMKRVIYPSISAVRFSQWSRKGYAVFAGLGKRIRISSLALHVCQCALLKSAEKGVIVSDEQCADDYYMSIDNAALFAGLDIAVARRSNMYGHYFGKTDKTTKDI